MDSATPKEPKHFADTPLQNIDTYSDNYDRKDSAPVVTEVSSNALLPPYLKSLSDIVDTDNIPSTTTQTEIELDSCTTTSSSSSITWKQPPLVETKKCYLCNPPRKRNFKDQTIDIRSKLLNYSSKPSSFFLKIQPLSTFQDPISDYILVPFKAYRVDISEKVKYVGNNTDVKTPLAPFNRPYLSTINISNYKSHLYENKNLKETNYPGIEVKNRSFVEFSIWNEEGTQIQLANYNVFTEYIDISLSSGLRKYIKYENKTHQTKGTLHRPSFNTTYTNFEIEVCLLNYGTRLFFINSFKLVFNFSIKMEVSARQSLVTNSSKKPIHLDHDIWYIRKERSIDLCVSKYSPETITPIGCIGCMTETANGHVLKPEIVNLEFKGPEVDGIKEKVEMDFDLEKKEQDEILKKQIEFLIKKNKEWREKRK